MCTHFMNVLSHTTPFCGYSLVIPPFNANLCHLCYVYFRRVKCVSAVVISFMLEEKEKKQHELNFDRKIPLFFPQTNYMQIAISFYSKYKCTNHAIESVVMYGKNFFCRPPFITQWPFFKIYCTERITIYKTKRRPVITASSTPQRHEKVFRKSSSLSHVYNNIRVNQTKYFCCRCRCYWWSRRVARLAPSLSLACSLVE